MVRRYYGRWYFQQTCSRLVLFRGYGLQAGDTVTLSMELGTTSEIGVRARFEVYLDNNNRDSYVGNIIRNGEGRSSVTVTIREDRPRFRVMVQPGTAPSPSSFLYERRRVKLEKATKPPTGLQHLKMSKKLTINLR